MSENPIAITLLNDFIFCPASIYFHLLEGETERIIYQGSSQLNGTASHEKSDGGYYSRSSKVLQGMSVYSSEFNLIGKIDVFDTRNGLLTERKRKIKTIYEGYIFQLYGQYYALTEMGYTVNSMKLYSMSDNKSYSVILPTIDREMDLKFRKTIKMIQNFNLNSFTQMTKEKCDNCIYEALCIYKNTEEE